MDLRVVEAAFVDELTKIAGARKTAAGSFGELMQLPMHARPSGRSLARDAALVGGGALAGAALTHHREKTAEDLTPEARSHIAPKNFAVSSKASNTGKPAYPIEDRAHAKSALGLSKMHGDSKDIAEVRKDVAAKYPDLVHKQAFAETLLPGTEGYYSDRMRSVLQGLAPRVYTPEGVVYTKFASALTGLLKEGGVIQAIGQKLAPMAGEMATHKAELAGLGTLALPSIDEAQAHARAAVAGDYSHEGVKKRTLLPSATKPLTEIGGLGILAAPSLAHLAGHH